MPLVSQSPIAAGTFRPPRIIEVNCLESLTIRPSCHPEDRRAEGSSHPRARYLRTRGRICQMVLGPEASLLSPVDRRRVHGGYFVPQTNPVQRRSLQGRNRLQR